MEAVGKNWGGENTLVFAGSHAKEGWTDEGKGGERRAERKEG